MMINQEPTLQELDKTYTTHLIEKLIVVCCFLAPAFIVPQAYEIWVKRNEEGVSILTWGAFTIISVVWILYGIKHKEFKVFIYNLLIFIMNLSVVAGLVFI